MKININIKFTFLFIFLIVSLQSKAQKGSYYGNPADAADFCAVQLDMTNSFSTNNEAQIALNKIINVLGISQRFAIYQCNGIDNCQAVTIRGVRYIFYDSYFMKDISNNANSSWTNLSILAHEIGHHINGHTVDLLAAMTGGIKSLTLSEKRQQELEADELSGYVMAKLGSTLYQSQQAINLSSFNGDDSYSTHPNKTKRLAAIERGFNKAKNASTISISTNNTSTADAEKYFYLAFNNQTSGNPNYEYINRNYTKAIELNPNYAWAYNNRGIAKSKQNQFYSAISDFDKCLEINPQCAEAYAGKSKAYFMLKDIKKSLEYINIGISVAPNSSIMYNNRGGVIAAMGDHYNAIVDYNKAIELNSNNTHAYLNRGLSKGALNNCVGGISDLDVVIYREPQNVFAYNMRGLMKVMIGQYFCGDFSMACQLGDCNNYNQYYSYCR
jgi:tetratricopeptide (TPR) repeat protein